MIIVDVEAERRINLSCRIAGVTSPHIYAAACISLIEAAIVSQPVVRANSHVDQALRERPSHMSLVYSAESGTPAGRSCIGVQPCLDGPDRVT